jgi:hypothetical protein
MMTMTTIYGASNNLHTTLAASSPGTGTSASGTMSSSMSQTLSKASALSGAGAPTHATTQSWYEAMAQAWGQAMNNQAQVITNLSDQINTGQDTPAQITQLTAESLRFSYLATNASTSTTSVGDGLESLGRKQ